MADDRNDEIGAGGARFSPIIQSETDITPAGSHAAGSGGPSRNVVRSYQDAGSLGSGVVSLTISHRKVWFARLSQRGGFTVPQSDNVVGLERYDKILAVAIEGHLSLEGKGVFSKGFDDVKR